MRYLPAILLLVSQAATSAQNCSEISDTRDRLTCFDMKFPRKEPNGESPNKTQPETPMLKNQPADEPTTVPRPMGEEVMGENVMEEKVIDTSTVPSSVARESGKQPAEKGTSWKIFGKHQVTIVATVKEILNRDRQKMVFLLSNDQVWLQTSPRNLPIRPGDQVTIKSGKIGGYIMRNTKGTSTRVQRID